MRHSISADIRALVFLLPLLCVGCALPATYQQLMGSRETYDRIQDEWQRSLDDPHLEAELKRAYLDLQRECRTLHGTGHPLRFEAKELCEPVEQPWAVRFTTLVAEKEDLSSSLFELNTPGTLANDYIRWPSRKNEQQLHRLFDQVTRYMRPPMSWELYRLRPEFQEARFTHYRAEFEALRETWKAIRAGTQHADQDELERLQRRLGFAFGRLKEELGTNQGLEASLVGPLTRATSPASYEVELAREAEDMAARAAARRAREVVVFIHGLANDRSDWRTFPELLSREDLVDPSLEHYFRVYNYRYQTRDNSRSVSEFAREFEVFLRKVRAVEEVDSVNVVAHSQGGVVALRALINAARGPLPEGADLPVWATPSARAQQALEATLRSPDRLIERLITLASPLHGDNLANVLVTMSVPEPEPYRRWRHLPWRVPYFGTRQTRDLRVGDVHLRSIARTDSEWILDPPGLLEYLEPGRRAGLSRDDLERLEAARVQVLSLVAIGHDSETLGTIEDDGLVKPYSANLRHHYLWGPGADTDIGLQQVDVRYIDALHYTIKAVTRRSEAAYRQVVGYLRGAPLPQEVPRKPELHRFQILLRAYPADPPEAQRPQAFFGEQPRVVYLDDEAYQVPSLDIRWESADGVQLNSRNWNQDTGIFSQTGSLEQADSKVALTVVLKAKGYQPRAITMPVEAGQVTYAVNVLLEPEPPATAP